MGTTIYHAVSIDQFYEHLVAGNITGVVAGPALTRDVFELYQAWCERRGIIGLASASYLANALNRRHGVQILRKRYAIGNSLLGPHGVLYLAMPPSARQGFEFEWLGQLLSKFTAAVAVYVSIDQGSKTHAHE